MTMTTNYPFTTPANYTYDSDKVEITGGIAKLKDISPTDSMSAGLFSSDIDLSWGGGTLTGTGTGSPTITSGQLDLTDASNQYVSYDADGNADSQQTGCMRVDYYPNYSGSPANTQYIMGAFRSHDDAKNSVQIFHTSSGKLYIQAKDSSGSYIYQANLGAWSPTASTKYVLEYNFDFTSGASRLFIDGTQFGSTRSETGTRDSNIGLLRLGQHVNGTSGQSDHILDNFVYFSTVQHTSNHTGELPFDDPVKYSAANETITTNSSFKSTELASFSETSTVAGSDAIKYTIVANGQDRYVTGGSAADSNGTYAESSTDTELSSDIENIITSRKTVYLKVFLHSDDGSTTPELDLVSIQYNAAADDPTTPTLSELEGWIYDINGPMSSETVEIRPYQHGYINQQIFHKYEWQTIGTTDSDGYFFGDLYVQKSGEFWEMKVGSKRYKLSIYDQAENYLWDLPTFEVIDDE